LLAGLALLMLVEAVRVFVMARGLPTEADAAV